MECRVKVEENHRVTARAGVNIALVKYWGKADTQTNMPAVGSISMTLSTLSTETQVARSMDVRL